MNQYLYKNPDLIYNSFSEDKVIALEPASMNLLELNQAGAYICSKLNGSFTLEEMIESLKIHCTSKGIHYDEKTFGDFIRSLQVHKFILASEEETSVECDSNWNSEFQIQDFNPRIQIVSDLSEGFFSKVFIDI